MGYPVHFLHLRELVKSCSWACGINDQSGNVPKLNMTPLKFPILLKYLVWFILTGHKCKLRFPGEGVGLTIFWRCCLTSWINQHKIFCWNHKRSCSWWMTWSNAKWLNAKELRVVSKKSCRTNWQPFPFRRSLAGLEQVLNQRKTSALAKMLYRYNCVIFEIKINEFQPKFLIQVFAGLVLLPA